jgi:hypothetical protein
MATSKKATSFLILPTKLLKISKISLSITTQKVLENLQEFKGTCVTRVKINKILFFAQALLLITTYSYKKLLFHLII